MVVGHYAASFAAKRLRPSIPLWVLFLAAQLIDIFWAVFILLRIERARVSPGVTPINPIDFSYMPYTHSLLAVILWSLAAALCYRFWARPRRWSTAMIVGAVVFSHWLLDLLVHRPVLPLYGDVFKVGLGLYQVPALALLLEVGLLFGAMSCYLGGTTPAGQAGRFGMGIFALVMVALLAFVSFGPPVRPIHAAATAALVSWLALVALAGWLERTRVPKRVVEVSTT